MAVNDPSGARARSKPRETSIGNRFDNPPDNPPRSLKVSKTVTFDLVTTKTDGGPYAEHISEPYATTVSLSTVNSQDPDEASNVHLLNHHGSTHESSIHLPHLLHSHHPHNLADRLASAVAHLPGGLRIVPAGILEKILEKGAIERAVEHLAVQAHEECHSVRDKLSAAWWRMIKAPFIKSSASSTTHEDTVRRAADHIHHKLRNIFATLLLIGHPQLIFDFVRIGIDDTDLPVRKFSAEDENGTSPITGLCVKDCPRNKSLQTACARCLKDWPLALINQFEETQWVTLSPVFHAQGSQDPVHHSLDENAILPFTYCKSIPRGSRGDILKVRIHAKHHNFDGGEWDILSTLRGSESESALLAVKKIADRDEFYREVSLLKRVVDPHVISLFATYEQWGKYHLIMPWAECNLEQFWEVNLPQPASPDSNILRWMARQCLGIASALRQVQHHLTFSRSSLFGESGSPHLGIGPKKSNSTPRHAFFGRHGDIKPQNMLWFPTSSSTSHVMANLGIIKICDFGEGEFNKAQSVHRSTDSISYTPSYRPPECDHPHEEVEIQSGTYDTWSLGCVYLEFITWYLGGWKSILEFEMSRYTSDGEVASSTPPRRSSPYFETTHQAPPQLHARIKFAVRESEQHFRRLRAIVAMQDVGTTNHGERDFLSAFLNLIQAYMLVVNPDGHKPHDGGSYRMTCNHVHEKLGDMGILIGIMDDVYDDEDTSRHRLRHLLRWHSSMALE